MTTPDASGCVCARRRSDKRSGIAMLTSSFERKVLGGLGLASLIIAGVTLSWHLGTEHLFATNGKVAQSFALLNSAGDLARNLQTAHMSTRGYVVSGDVDLKRMHESAQREIERAVAELRAAVPPTEGLRRALVFDIDRMSHKRLEEDERLMQVRDLRGAGGIVS